MKPAKLESLVLKPKAPEQKKDLSLFPIAAMWTGPVQMQARENARAGVDTDKYDRCVTAVKKKGSANNAYAVCGASLQKTKEAFEGMRLGRKECKEANSSTVATAVLVGPKKESLAIQIGWRSLRDRLRESESGAEDLPSRVKVILISEGLGNLKDRFYYGRETLESAVPVFEGAQCYANHPTQQQEQEMPERDVRDLIGHFENVHVEDASDGGAELCADLVLITDPSKDWVRGQIKHDIEYAKKYPDKNFVGLSINADGESEGIDAKDLLQRGVPASAQPKLDEAIAQGGSQVKLVTRITDAVSCDLVTKAGAGGRVLEIIE